MYAKESFARAVRGAALLTTVALGVCVVSATADEERAFLPSIINSSTIPMNGDLNPYGVAFVPKGFPTVGTLKPGDVLVSNFNDTNNAQGRGTTIVKLSPGAALAPPGAAMVFFASRLPGLSTALGVLRTGFVIVGNVSTVDGTFKTIGPGALQIISPRGTLLQTWTDPVLLDGPWDLTIHDQGQQVQIFVSNVLNGTVTRLDVAVGGTKLTLLKKTMIAKGYQHVPNGAALVLGPTGLALDVYTDTLYIASTADNKVFAISHASSASTAVTRGSVIFASSHLRGPLALRLAPNGNLLTANGDAVNADAEHPSEIVEFTKEGTFVRQYDVDASLGGAFGLDTVHDDDAPFNLAVIDDVTNNLTVSKVQTED